MRGTIEEQPVTLVSIGAFLPAQKMNGDSDRHQFHHPSMMVVVPSEKDLQTPPICLGDEVKISPKMFNPNNLGGNWISFLNVQ